ncbi:MAG: alpha-amylase family glycosyl hydrolase, partial [Chitinophagales bacterium]
MKKKLLLIPMLITANHFLYGQNMPDHLSGEEKAAYECDHRVFYEIFVRSFYDSNGDGIGDLNGITEKLDYLHKLGIGGIWITPFNPSPSYHKYDVVDYYGVDPQYGTLDDFKKLVSEAHKRNIYVLMDLVVNHTSPKNSWFIASVKNDPKYRNYYSWEKDPPETKEGGWYLPRDEKGNVVEGEKYFGFFSRSMPDLNYDNPEVRKEIINVGKWWLNETGIDGFRLDAAQHIYDPEHPAKNVEWWKEFTDSLKKVKPDLITIGECWNHYPLVAQYLPALSGAFNFQLSWALLKSLKEEKDDSVGDLIYKIRNDYASYSKNFIDPIFLSNHDNNRILSDLDNNEAKARLGACIYLTLPGTPFIYYGEEIGMKGMKPDSLIREPFLWGEKHKRQPEHQTHW